VEIGLVGVQREEQGQRVYRRVQHWLLAALGKDDVLPAVQRAAAGRLLAKLGDPREAVLIPEKIEWHDISAGPCLMGEERQKYTIPYDYKIAQYPITNAQFQAFVQAGGYGEKVYWREAEQAGVWQEGKGKGIGNEVSREGPYDWGEPFTFTNHPVVGITWYEALAFTRWLTQRLVNTGVLPEGWSIQLPNEPEWEKAARGTDGRKYPWGENADSNKANYVATGIHTTSAVGCFPQGASPNRIEEMSGNMLEWTRSVWVKDLYPEDVKARQEREHLAASKDKARVLRGGAFDSPGHGLRRAYRHYFHPYYRYYFLGFRVVASPFLPSDL